MAVCFLVKSILIVSGGIEAIPGIKRAKEMGLFVVVSDGNPNAPGFEYADDQIISSTYDIENSLLKATEYHNSIKKLDGVMCIASDVPLTVATIANKLNLPGIPISAAKLAVDKLSMKNKFHKDNVPIPNYTQLKNKQQLISIISNWGLPLVIKPIDSRGARGVIRITKDVNINWAWNHSKKNSPTGRVIVEKYLEGPQVSTESIMLDGKCYTIGFSDRNYEFLEKYAPYIIENGGDLPSILPDDIQLETKLVVEKAALSMGITNGVVKGDIVIHKNKPFIIELAARLSGGYFCTHEIPMNTGVDFIGNAIKIAIGQTINKTDLIPKFNKFICQRYLFPKAGIIKEIKGLNRLEENKSIKYYNLHIKPGQKIDVPIAHPSRAGMLIAEGNSRLDAKKNVYKGIKLINFIYES